MIVDSNPGEPGPPESPEHMSTGLPRVDEVMRAVEELEERPIEEHLGVYEAAQTQLRQALDDPHDTP